MNYAIIAAGEGSRLKEEGVNSPKPLVELNGERMIERLIRIFSANNAEAIFIIVNESMREVSDYLSQQTFAVPVKTIICSTPSSMHSFYLLSEYLPQGKFCLTTVDTIFTESEFAQYIQTFEQMEGFDALFAVTDYIEDESPLYVEVDCQMRVKGFFDQPTATTKYISGGIYGLNSNAITVLQDAMAQNRFRMRNYQRALLEHNQVIKAYPFHKIIDVDHAADIHTAAQFIASFSK